ncbi:MAG: sensor histidine kinase [Candidatus Binatia bacterium]
MDKGVLEELGKIESGKVEVYGENLDILRFSTERFSRIFSEYLTEKYADQPPNLIILVYVGKLGIAGPLLQQLFPGTPVIVAGHTEEEIRPGQFGSLVSGIAQRIDARGSLELILRLQPETRRIVVIGGTAEVDRDVLNRLKEAALSLAGQVEVDFWDNRTVNELRQSITALPPQTAILFTRMFQDAAGEALISGHVGQWIGQSANVPVYLMTDTSLGTGAVGGAVASVEAFGRRAGELARLILTGTTLASLPLEIRTDSLPIFDWRALKRWGIPESRLPPGSMVRFKPRPIWEQYGWYIIAALSVITIQAAIIGDLFLHRARRRRAEKELEESHHFMEMATKAGKMGLWMRDLERGEVWADAHFRALFGFGQTDVIRYDDDVLARIHPYDRARMALDVERAEKNGLSFEGEFRVILPDSDERWVATRGESVNDRRGRPVRRLGAVIDITDRKRAEETLRESEEHYRTLAETAADVIITMDQDSTILFVNAAVEKVFGYVPADLIGQKMTVLMPEPLRHRHVEGMRRYLETSEKRLSWSAVSFPGLHKSGREISLEIAFAESRIGNRRVFTGIIRDITERKRAEAELRKQRAELAHVARVSTMGELAASLAHELNQPLTAILSNAQAALRFMTGKPADLEEVREILHDIVQDNSRAGEVIRQMRALVKKEEPEFSSLDLASIVREIVLLVHSDAVLRNVGVSLDVSPDLPYARGDKVQLQQVLLNLLLNAFDAMKDCPVEEREVIVHASSDGAGMVRISIGDCGTGLTSDKLEKIFQPFYTTKREGLGMGLSISRSIIEAHGGRLWAENNNGRGATFHFTVPLERRNEEEVPDDKRHH